MANRAIETFRQQISSDPELAARVRSEGTSPDAIVRIAEDAGCRFTVAELSQAAGGELADDQLENVAGGARTSRGLSEAPFQILYDYLFWQKR